MTQALPFSSPSAAPVFPADKSRFLGVRKAALVEMIVLLSFLTFSGHFLFPDGGEGFSAYAFHPFWFVLLLVTVQYGLGEAMACAVLASLFLIFDLPQQSMTETFYDYLRHITLLPFLWLGFAAMGGTIRSRQLYEREQLRIERDQARVREESIALRYKKLSAARKKLEARLAGETTSFLSIFQNAKMLQTLDEDQIIEGLKKFVGLAAGPTQFSFFYLKKDALVRQFAEGWPHNRYQRRIRATSALYQRIVGNKKAVCVLNPEDEALLGKEGMLALPVFDPRRGEVFGMLKLEAMPFNNLHFHTIERCRLLAQWTGMALANARRHQKLADSLVSFTRGSAKTSAALAAKDATRTPIRNRHAATGV